MKAARRKAYGIVDRAVDRAVEKVAKTITAEIAKLHGVVDRHVDDVPYDYATEALITRLLRDYPELMDWLNKRSGDGSLRLASALEDWRDLWAER